MRKDTKAPSTVLPSNAPSGALLSPPQAALGRAALRRSPGERSTGPFADPAHPTEADTAEALLQGLIAECGAIIREQVRPAIDATADRYEKCAYANAAVSLVKIGAKVGDAIARLRGQQAPELRQRITVERIQSLSPSKGEGG